MEMEIDTHLGTNLEQNLLEAPIYILGETQLSHQLAVAGSCLLIPERWNEFDKLEKSQTFSYPFF